MWSARQAGRRAGRAAAIVRAAAGLALALAAGAPAAVALDHADKLEMVDMLRRGSLTKLETWLAAYQNAFENGRASDGMVDHAYSAFANSDPELAATLDGWVDKRPGSYAALMARADYYANLVRIAGADAPTEETRAEGRRAMDRLAGLARADLEAALARKPRLSVAYARLIELDTRLANAADAEFVMRKGLDLVPGSFAIRAAYLDGLVPWGRPGLTVAEARQSVARFMKEIEYSAGQYADLRPLLGYPDFVEGQVLSGMGRHAAAALHFQQALSHGAYWLYHYGYGLSHERDGQYVFALQSYDRALALHPQTAEVLARRGWAYWGLDDRSGAVAEWDQALALDALEPDTLYAKAIALEALGRTDEALAAYDKAAVYGAWDDRVRAGRGALRLNRLGDFAGAVEDLRAATDLAPDRIAYWHDLAVALDHVDRCDAGTAEVLASYIRLCRSEGGCPDDQLIWAAGAVEEIMAGACVK